MKRLLIGLLMALVMVAPAKAIPFPTAGETHEVLVGSDEAVKKHARWYVAGIVTTYYITSLCQPKNLIDTINVTFEAFIDGIVRMQPSNPNWNSPLADVLVAAMSKNQNCSAV